MASRQLPDEKNSKTEFLDLSAELRNNIYELASAISKDKPGSNTTKARPHDHSWTRSQSERDSPLATLRQTCRQIHKEITPMFFAHRRFRLDFKEFSSLLEAATANDIAYLGDIRIDITKPLDLSSRFPQRCDREEWEFFKNQKDVFEHTRTAISEVVMKHGNGKLQLPAIKVRLPFWEPERHHPGDSEYCGFDHTLCDLCYRWKDVQIEAVKEWQVVHVEDGRWRAKRGTGMAPGVYTRMCCDGEY